MLYNPKRKFLRFISSVQYKNIRLFSNLAYIDGSKLSGILDGSKFLIKIMDNGVDIEEVNTNLSNYDMINRIIDDIDDMDVIGYNGKFIINGLDFYNEDGYKFYLEVFNEKPFDLLKSLIQSD